MVDRILDALLGPDEDEDVDGAIEQDQAATEAGAIPMRRPDYTVEVTYDKGTKLFSAVMKTKTSVVPMDAQGQTPGEAFAYAGSVLDTSLVRRGFGKD